MPVCKGIEATPNYYFGKSACMHVALIANEKDCSGMGAYLLVGP